MNQQHQPSSQGSNWTRREFVRAAGAGAAGLALVRPTWAQAQAATDPLNVAIVGTGREGRILLNLALKIPELRFKAVCDIWSYSQRIGKGLCKRAGHKVNVYERYQDMLQAEKDLDAVIIATPDFVHHEITNACLNAGLHVYCEKEMSNDLEKARSMVQTASSTGKLLQIGHQRRSNPYYIHARHLLLKDKFCGHMTAINGQWNQLKPLRPMPAALTKKYGIPQEKLEEFGYGSMQEFYEWRWFNKYAGGPMTDLGSHQVDVYIWYMGKPPKAVTAFGNNDHAKWEAKKYKAGYEPQCFDHTMCVYEWDSEIGTIHAYYQVLLTSSNGGFYETFMGDEGTMRISEIRDKQAMFREKVADSLAWEDDAQKFEGDNGSVMKFDPMKSRNAKGKMTDAAAKKLMADMEKPAHQPHIENFFAAVRDKNIKLNCPAEIGYETAVAVIKANESAVAGGRRIEFKEDDFIADASAKPDHKEQA